MIYYIADTHFGSEFIFKHCERPFFDVNECDEVMLRKWNSKVKADDVVYHLGDVAEKWDERTIGLLSCLNGHKILILGNHDLEWEKEIRKSGVFEEIHELTKIKDQNREVWLSHYPLFTWPDDHQGSYFVYGHIHNAPLENILSYYEGKRAYNAGVDMTGFEPMSLDELEQFYQEDYKNMLLK